MSAKRNNCMFALPNELTGMGTTCGLFRGQLPCNGYGRKCTGYLAHNAESRKALDRAIAEKRNQKDATDAN